jgi:hypothetical protein
MQLYPNISLWQTIIDYEKCAPNLGVLGKRLGLTQWTSLVILMTCSGAQPCELGLPNRLFGGGLILILRFVILDFLVVIQDH